MKICQEYQKEEDLFPGKKKKRCALPFVSWSHYAEEAPDWARQRRKNVHSSLCSRRFFFVFSLALFLSLAFLRMGSPPLFADGWTNAGPYTITATTLVATNFRLNSEALKRGSVADAVEIDVIATHLVISKKVMIPGRGIVTFVIKTTGNMPVHLFGLRSHVVSFTSDQGIFSNLDVSKRLLPDPVSPVTVTPSPEQALMQEATPLPEEQEMDEGPDKEGEISLSEPTPTILHQNPEQISQSEEMGHTPTPLAQIQSQSTPSPPLATPLKQTGGDGTGGGSEDVRNVRITLSHVKIEATFLVAATQIVPNILISVQ